MNSYLRGLLHAHHCLNHNPKNRSGNFLEDTVATLDVVCLISGGPIFISKGVRQSVLNLTFASPKIKTSWAMQPDTCCHHTPIIVTSPKTSEVPIRTFIAVNRGLCREYMKASVNGTNTMGLTVSFGDCLRLATRKSRFPSRSVPRT